MGAFYFRLGAILLKHLSFDFWHSEGGRIREETQRSNMLKIGKKSLISCYLSSCHPWVWQSREWGFPSHCCWVRKSFWLPLPPQGTRGCCSYPGCVTLTCCLLHGVHLGSALKSQYPEIKTCLVIWYHNRHSAELLMHDILNELKAHKSFWNQN